MSGEVLVSVENGVGRLRLNRPRAIHALTTEMCEEMARALLAWRDDDAVRLILIDHAEGRGFCAGGDIRLISESGATDGVAARHFFLAEYRLNHLLFTYPKPVAAIVDGIVMGGGVGISQPALFRIATERTVFAMPESGIGLFPDVGAGWYLSRLPGRMGEYLATTGARLDAGDCMALGLSTHFISSEKVEEVKAALIADPANAELTLARANEAPPPSRLAEHREEIDRTFASDRYEDILAALKAEGTEWAEAQLATLATKSPTTCKVSLRELAEGRTRTDFAEEMKIEYRLGSRICRSADFIEGVWAVIVDKDHAPRWKPATPEEISDAAIDALFVPLPADEEWTPL